MSNTYEVIEKNGIKRYKPLGGGGASSWSELENKPFESIGDGLKVDEDGVLSSIAKGGMLPRLHIVSETGSTVTVIKDDITLTPTEMSGVWECDIPEYGTWTVHSVNPDGDAIATVYIDMVKIYNIDDSHFSATIIATFPSGATCSCSKGEQTYYATTSPFTFSIHSVGTWVVTATKDGVTVSKEVNIINEGQSTNVVLEMATIRLTVDEEFIGSEITGTNGTDTKRWTADSTERVFTVNFGTWKFSTTKDDKLYETSEVVVDSYIEYEANLKFAHGLDYTEWLTAGKVTKSFDSLESVLADQETVRQLMTVHASVDYLRANCDEANAETIFNAYYVMKWVNISDYALDKLSEVAEIKATMDEVGMYGYGEVTLEKKNAVPIMTSNTTPSGEAISGGTGTAGSANIPYKVFDGNDGTRWYYKDNDPKAWIGYKFDEPTTIESYYFKAIRIKTFTIDGSNDGQSWEELTDIVATQSSGNVMFEYSGDIAKVGKYKCYRLNVLSTNNAYEPQVYKLQFYSNTPTLKGCVPVMTSNTAPYGTASAYQVFDGSTSTSASGTDFSYNFTNPVCVKKFTSDIDGGTLQVSNDGTTWKTADDNYYLYARVHYSASKTVHNIQFYGREFDSDYSEKEFAEGSNVKYLYDHGVEVETATKTATSVLATVDTTAYKLLRATDDTYAQTTDKIQSGSANAVVNGLPNNNYLDISSVNGNNATGFSIINANNFEHVAFWLEK